MSMVRPSVVSGEWWVGDRSEHLGWICLVQYQRLPTYVWVTRNGWVVGGGGSLPDATRAFIQWRTEQHAARQ